MLTNLVGNAIKFSDRGKVAVRVQASAESGGVTRLRFEVADTGIGIPDHAQRQLFQAFEQVDTSASRRHGGTGLGLAISKQLVEMMGGDIGFESTLAPGAPSGSTSPLPWPALLRRRSIGRIRSSNGSTGVPASWSPRTTP